MWVGDESTLRRDSPTPRAISLLSSSICDFRIDCTPSPRALAVDSHGRIFVADFFDIKVFDEGGNYVTSIGLNDGVPFGIVTDNQDHVYVVTSQNHVIRYDVNRPAEN